jgi:hypothetical protein
MKLTVVYNFHSSSSQEGIFRPASYKVIYFFSDRGFIEDASLRELAKSVPDANHDLLTFTNLDDLKAFALRVCQEHNAPEVRLISSQDYNIGIDGAKDLITLKNVFDTFGDLIANDESLKKSPSLLKKFFS